MNKEFSERKEQLKRDMEKRKHLQRISEMLENIKGVKVLKIYESDVYEQLKNTEYFVYDKIPESRINCYAENEEICKWITNCMDWHNGDTVFLLFNNICAEAEFTNIETAVDELWHKSGKCITVLAEQKDVLKEVCGDSRDEYHYLFDTYALTKN